MLTIINYHYIDPIDGINGISTERFLQDVYCLRKKYHLVGIGEIAAAKSINDLPEQSCLITFDDGLKCHYDVSFLMIEHNFPAAFFISGLPIAEKRVAEVHKNQYLRAALGIEEFRKKINSLLGKSFEFSDVSAKTHYRYDDIETARFKYLVNYVLPNDVKSEILGKLFSQVIEDEAAFCEKWYMSRDEIRFLQESFEGCIGSHAWTHRPLATLEEKEVLAELEESGDLLGDITGTHIYALSYPLGNPDAVGSREISCARKAGYTIGLTMTRNINDNLDDRLGLGRFDRKDIFQKVVN